jgi:hypothetical protein
MFVKITSILLIALLTLNMQKSFGQELLSELPTTKEDFIASEKKVIATIDWIEATPFDKEEEKRTKQKALLIAWITNSPTVTVEINSRMLTFHKKNADLLVIFMGGWTKYCLQNNYSKDIVQSSLAGIRSAIKVYKNLSLKKDKNMEKLIGLEDKGDLEKWVTEKLENK